MDLFDLFFGAGPAVQAIMKLGYMPKQEDFLELTPEQYEKYFESEGFTEEKIYALLPQDPRRYVNSDFNELVVFSESDIETLKRGWQIVENYCKNAGKEFATEREKLEYTASKMPDVFSKGTPFEYVHETNLRISHINK